MKNIRVCYIDFWRGFKYTDFILHQNLAKVYNVTVVEPTDSDIDLMIYTCFGSEHFKYNCKKLEWIGENTYPDFNEADYAIGSSYGLVFNDRFCRIPFYVFRDVYENYSTYHKEYEEKYKHPENRGFCGCLISNINFMDPFKEEMFRRIHHYKNIDSAGWSLNTLGYVIPKDEGGKNTRDFLANYKFNFCFENSAVTGYTTEKIMQAFACYTIPIYWGDPLVGMEFNKDAFINIDKENPDKGLDYIKYLDTHDDEYLEVLKTNIGLKNHYYAIIQEFLQHAIEGPIYEHNYGHLGILKKKHNLK
jgi:hypothetical protein